jgi:mannose-1-phosphate guanylyltransferase/mannose-6-phosphate isomerase
MNITPVILCGGSGTRLWPLSRKSFPKQFVPLIDNKSLLQLTLERVATLCAGDSLDVGNQHIICVASEEHRFLVSDAIEAATIEQINKTVLLEPIGRNTAAAMAIAALTVQQQKDNSEELLLFCPADHHIPDSKAFANCIAQGIQAANNGSIVTFGVSPAFPSTAYGYIETGDVKSDGSKEVIRFIEKPKADVAQQLLLKGGVLWNAGIFLVKVSTLIEALNDHAPDILATCRESMTGTQKNAEGFAKNSTSNSAGTAFLRPSVDAFTACRSESIDYAVMEHFKRVAVVPFDGQWSDVGSWNAVADLSPTDEQGNRVQGQGHLLKANNTFVHAPHRTVVALGTQNLLIIDTPDALLVAHRDHAENVKEVVQILDKAQLPQAVMHRKVARPWGWYDSVDMGNRFQVKRIGVKPGASLSLQMHHHRAEHWIVVAGTAKVTRGNETFLLSENQSTYIPIGAVHRLSNPGKVDLEMIEVQSGNYLGEDDIVRLEDTYGRASLKNQENRANSD